jgi:hypothetical protein
MRAARPVTRTGEMSNAYESLVIRPEVERPFDSLGVFGRMACY